MQCNVLDIANYLIVYHPIVKISISFVFAAKIFFNFNYLLSIKSKRDLVHR